MFDFARWLAHIRNQMNFGAASASVQRRACLGVEVLEGRTVPTGVVASYSVTQDWGSGFQGQLQLLNQQTQSIPDWKLEFDLAAGISSIWDARILSHAGNHYVIANAGWNATLPAGGAVAFGFIAAPGRVAAPLNYVLNGVPFNGSSTPVPTPTPPAPTPPPAPTSSGDFQFKVTSDWSSGFNGELTIRNNGTTTRHDWSVEFELPAQVSSVWNANLQSRVGNHYVIKNAGWNIDLAPGASVAIGFTATPGGGSATASSFKWSGSSVTTGGGTIGGGGTGSGTTQPGSPGATAWPAHFFAPYVDLTLYPTYDLVAAARDHGIKNFTLAFIVADAAKQPSWGGYSTYEVNGGAFDQQIRAQFAGLRALGGDAPVSFGGAANQELAQVITDGATLKAAYQSVVSAYNLSRIDFDIEGAAVADRASIDRRSQAVAGLQQDAAAAGKNLQVWLTLPVLPTGLTGDGEYVIQSALHFGVQLSGVNIMAMDYGDGVAPNPQGRMGDYAIQAANSLFGQLKTAYGSAKTDAELWTMVGITPMIGMNDVTTEIFDQQEARELATFAKQKGIGMIGMWSLNRDRQNAAGAIRYVEATSSSLLQQPFEFSQIFEGFVF